VGHVAGDEHQVERAIPDHLIGDMHPTASRVPGLGLHRVILADRPWPERPRCWVAHRSVWLRTARFGCAPLGFILSALAPRLALGYD
jgi:hypothetical protein